MNKKKENLKTKTKSEEQTVEQEQPQPTEEAAECVEQPEEASEEVTQTDKLEQEIRQLKEQNLRQLAEFDNYRKRTQRERLDTYKNATADCALHFISVLDNLERALEASEEQSEIKTGVEMIVTQFREVLNKMDIHEIKAQNETFDPERHNAVNQVEDENYGENTVCQVLQKGYHMGDKVLRPAMVVVANP